MGALSFIHTTLQNAAVLPEYQSFSTTTQRNAVHLKYLSTSHCSSWCSDGNLGTATYHRSCSGVLTNVRWQKKKTKQNKQKQKPVLWAYNWHLTFWKNYYLFLPTKCRNIWFWVKKLKTNSKQSKQQQQNKSWLSSFPFWVII